MAWLLFSWPGRAGDTATSLLRQARQAEKAGDAAQAYIKYAEAAAQDPENETNAWARSLALRTQALLETKALPAGLDGRSAGDASAVEDSLFGEITDQEIAEARQPLPPLELEAVAGVHGFDIKGDAKQIFEEVARAYGLEVVFDADFQAGKPLRFRADDLDYREALRAVCELTGAFVVPVSERVALVAQDTQQKRQELEHNMAVVLPIPEPTTVQEAQEVAQAVQQLMDIQKAVVDGGKGLVLMRDRVSRVRVAQSLLEQLMLRRPEFVIEVEFIEASEIMRRRYGIGLPSSAPLVWLGDLLGNKPPAGELASGLVKFGGGASLIGLGIANAEVFASMTRTDAAVLLSSQLRTVSGQPATLHVGDRYPIQTQGYFGATGGGGEVFLPPPTINFEDLGLVVKVTPYAHGDDEVTIEVEAEFKVLAGAAINNIPIIATRSIQATTRLRNDEWAVVAGLVRSSEVRAISGLAGLSHIPYLGALVRRDIREADDRRTLLVI